MNVLLWVFQAALALLAVSGGVFKVSKVDELTKMPATSVLPRGVWRGLGVLEIVCGVLLVVPAALNWMPVLTLIGAAVFALENLALAAMYGRHSLRLNASNPLVYVVVGGVMAAFVAYGRYALTA